MTTSPLANPTATRELLEEFGPVSYTHLVYNADLANSWGNLISRSLNMSGKYFDGCAPAKPASFDAFDLSLIHI